MKKSIVVGCLVFVGVVLILLCCCGGLGFWGYKSYIGTAEKFLGTTLPKGYFPLKMSFNTKNYVTYKFMMLSTPSGNKITITEGPLANNKAKKTDMLNYLRKSAEDNLTIEHIYINTDDADARETFKIGDKEYSIFNTSIDIKTREVEGASLIDNTKTHTRLYTYIPDNDETTKAEFKFLLEKVFE